MARTIKFPDGDSVPALGQGTWMMGERAQARAGDIAVIRRGVELGMTLVDTAEMYGDGTTERMLGEALAGLRDQVYLVSKVLPGNASRKRTIAACEHSLKRLKTDRLDLYLLHWRGGEPLEETLAGFQDLQRQGKIRQWGVSNFDVDDMEELEATGAGQDCATNQILYNVARRGPEFALLPWMRERRMPVMAYSPIDHARLPASAVLDAISRAHGVTPTQIALAWVLSQPDVIAIPKASSLQHLRENHRALDLKLTADDLARIDRAFPPPTRKVALELL